MIAALNGNQRIRLALTDESPTTSGTFVGVGFGSTANFNDPNGGTVSTAQSCF